MTGKSPVEVHYRDGPGDARLAGRHTIVIHAGRHTVERIVPPAGERFAFDADRWDYRIEVCVSRTGRSVRLWANGQEIDLPPKEPHA